MGTQERIKSLKERKAKIEQELSRIEAREKAKERKEETRLKVLIGSAILSEAPAHPEIVQPIQEILARAITAPRDQELLTRKGWLPKREKTKQGSAKVEKEQ